MKLVIIAVVALLLVGGGGAAWYLGIIGGNATPAAPTAASSAKKKSDLPEIKPLSDDDLREFMQNSIEKRSGRTMVKTEEIKGKPLDYDKVDFADPNQRMKARGQVLDEINAEREASLKEMYLHDKQAQEKKTRGDAVTRWLQRNDH